MHSILFQAPCTHTLLVCAIKEILKKINPVFVLILKDAAQNFLPFAYEHTCYGFAGGFDYSLNTNLLFNQ